MTYQEIGIEKGFAGVHDSQVEAFGRGPSSRSVGSEYGAVVSRLGFAWHELGTVNESCCDAREEWESNR